jgi:hypothetical protein
VISENGRCYLNGPLISQLIKLAGKLTANCCQADEMPTDPSVAVYRQAQDVLSALNAWAAEL